MFLMQLSPASVGGFDVTKPENIGKPLYFNLETHIASVVQLICSDELELAFKLMDMLPAWWMEPENYPHELKEMKKMLYRQMYSPFDYAEDPGIEDNWDKEYLTKQGLSQYFYPRGDLLAAEIKKLNDIGKTPWLFECSPSTGSMALGFIAKGLKFKYNGKNLNEKLTDKVKGWLEDVWQECPDINQETIFISYECLEHSAREEDIKHIYYKLGIEFDQIFVSVPYGCLFGGLSDWSTRRLGHVRGYSTGSFIKLVNSFWPEFNWQYYKAHSQILVGKR
jgi:hypothetical protein